MDATISQLEELFYKAQSAVEREIVLKTLRIINPDTAKVLEANILRQRIIALPLVAVCKLLASQKQITEATATKEINILIFEQLLDKSKMSAIETEIHVQGEEAPSKPSIALPNVPVIPTVPVPPIPPIPAPPVRTAPLVPQIPPVTILEPGSVLEEVPHKHPLLPKNLNAE
jgi:hypothetical protein